jgi:hypothetical protein
MVEGKIRIPALEGAPEEIAAYKAAFHSMQSPDWKKNAIQNDAAADRYLKEAQAIANGDPRLEIAICLWHKFAQENVITWEDETHKAEYLLAVDDITTGQLFNLLVRRLNYDGSDTASLTLGEVSRAVDGASI